nr:unnamed protein product [Callosobruchus analis]
MALLCATCSKAIITSQVNIACSKCLKCFHASCVNLTANEVTFLNDSTDKWSCPVCCRQGRITRSNSSSSGVRPGTPTRRDTEGSSATDTLALILSQLSAMANDIKDIKSSQAQLSTDVAYCRTLLQQHSDSISRHDDKIATCEADIQSLQNAQTELSSNIAVIESKLTTAMNSNAPNRCTSTNDPANQAETLEILRRSHNVLLRGVPEGDNDPNLVTDIISHIDSAANAHRVSATRLGRLTSRPRLIKVTFASPVFAKNVLRKKSSILSHPSLNSVKILDDKTPTQMQQLQDLREELRHRQAAGETDITIKYVQGTPSIVPLSTQEPRTSKN